MALKGNNVLIFSTSTDIAPVVGQAEWNAIAATKSNDIEASADTQEVTNPTNGLWKGYRATKRGWSLTTSWLAVADTDVRKLLLVGNRYALRFMRRGASPTSASVQGYAILEKCKISSAIGNLVTGSFVFRGDGPLGSPFF